MSSATTSDLPASTGAAARRSTHRLRGRRLLFYGVPLAVAALGLVHPGGITNPAADGDTFLHMLGHQADLFVMVHLLQLVVFGLLALVVWHLTDGLRQRAATVSRVAVLVFVVFYTAFDSVAGIAVGVLVQRAQRLPAGDRAGASNLIEAYQDSWVVGELNVLAIVGTGAWLVALVAAAVALRRSGATWVVFVCLVLAGLVFSVGHPAPFGPMGMGFLLVAIWRLDAAGLLPQPPVHSGLGSPP